MKTKIFYLGIVLLVSLSLCISQSTQTPEKTEEPQGTETTTQTPEVTEAPSTAPASTPSSTTSAPATPAPTPGKKELILNEEKTQNKITVKIIKLYYVDEPKYGTKGDLETHLRVELSITNNSDSTIEFYPNLTSVIEDDMNNQYVVLSMPSSKNWGEINSGETREGYIVFPEIEDEAKMIMLILRNDTTVIKFTIEIQNL